MFISDNKSISLIRRLPINGPQTTALLLNKKYFIYYIHDNYLLIKYQNLQVPMTEKTPSFLENTDAVSEVIGEILLTAVAVIAFSVVAVFIFSQAGPQEKVHADIQGWVGVDSDTIYLRHAGGEAVNILHTGLLLDINGTRRQITAQDLAQIKGSDNWVLGETIMINTSDLWTYDIGRDDNIAVTLLDTGTNLVIKSGTLLGSDQAVVTTPGGQTPVAPLLSGRNPPTPYQSNTSQPVTFSASSSQASINEFLLNGQHVAWSNGTSPSYTNTSASTGTYNLALIARNPENSSLTDSMEWTWTVVDVSTGHNASGVDMRLQKSDKGGYISDGDYISFRTTTGNNYIEIEGSNTNIKNNKDVMLVMNGQQTSGQVYMGSSGGLREITIYDFNVELYLDGSPVDTGQVTGIYIDSAENLESTLSYHLPSHLSQTYFSENADNNILIDSPSDASEIWLYNITPSASTDLVLQFNASNTDMDGFDADYEII